MYNLQKMFLRNFDNDIEDKIFYSIIRFLQNLPSAWSVGGKIGGIMS